MISSPVRASPAPKIPAARWAAGLDAETTESVPDAAEPANKLARATAPLHNESVVAPYLYASVFNNEPCHQAEEEEEESSTFEEAAAAEPAVVEVDAKDVVERAIFAEEEPEVVPEECAEEAPWSGRAEMGLFALSAAALCLILSLRASTATALVAAKAAIRSPSAAAKAATAASAPKTAAIPIAGRLTPSAPKASTALFAVDTNSPVYFNSPEKRKHKRNKRKSRSMGGGRPAADKENVPSMPFRLSGFGVLGA